MARAVHDYEDINEPHRAPGPETVSSFQHRCLFSLDIAASCSVKQSCQNHHRQATGRLSINRLVLIGHRNLSGPGLMHCKEEAAPNP